MIRMLQRHLILTWKSIFSSYSHCCWLISRALLGLASWYAAAAMIHDTVRTRSTSAPRHLYRFLLFLTLIKSISKPISVILSILDISARNKLCPSYPKKHIKNFLFSIFFSLKVFTSLLQMKRRLIGSKICQCIFCKGRVCWTLWCNKNRCGDAVRPKSVHHLEVWWFDILGRVTHFQQRPTESAWQHLHFWIFSDSI